MRLRTLVLSVTLIVIWGGVDVVCERLLDMSGNCLLLFVDPPESVKTTLFVRVCVHVLLAVRLRRFPQACLTGAAIENLCAAKASAS
jgi:hypothetical protein